MLELSDPFQVTLFPSLYNNAQAATLLMPISTSKPGLFQGKVTHLSRYLFSCCVQLFATPWTAAHQAFLSFAISQSLLKLMSIESVMPSSHLLCCPLLLLPIIFPSIRVFSNELALLNRWPKYWSFSFNRRGLIAGVNGSKFVFCSITENLGLLTQSTTPLLAHAPHRNYTYSNSSTLNHHVSNFYTIRAGLGSRELLALANCCARISHALKFDSTVI